MNSSPEERKERLLRNLKRILQDLVVFFFEDDEITNILYKFYKSVFKVYFFYFLFIFIFLIIKNLIIHESS